MRAPSRKRPHAHQHVRIPAPWLAALALALILAACTPEEPLVIGFAGQLQGPYSDMGVQARNGAMLAVEEANAQGGVDGRPLLLMARDDGNTPEGARFAVHDLHGEGAVAIVGHMTSTQTLAGYPEAERLNLAMVSPNTTTPLLSARKDLFFRVIPDYTPAIRALAKYCREHGGVRTVVQFTGLDNETFARHNTETFAKTFQSLGGRILDHILLPVGEKPDWDALANRLLLLAPDAVQVSVNDRDLTALAQILRIKAPDMRIYSPTWGLSLSQIPTGGKTEERITFVTGLMTDKARKTFRAFQDRFSRRFGMQPHFGAARGYEAAQLVIDALRRTGGRAEGLPQAIVALGSRDGLLSPIHMDACGDVTRPAAIATVRDNRIVILSTFGNEP